jgi:putative ABC transport system permease protein
MFSLIVRSATYHWRTNLAVVLGVTVAVSVLAGALLVGDSVRGSLRDLAVGRLGRADYVVSSTGFFRDALAEDVRANTAGASAAPLVVATGFVTEEGSGRRAANVLVYGVDARFWQFHGQPEPPGVQISPALASELGAKAGGVLLVRLQKPSAIPLESLFGRKDEIARTVRLDVGGILPREKLGEFALRPQQSEVRAVFAPLRRVQRDLGVTGKVNTLLVSGADETRVDAGVKKALTLEDLDVKVSTAAEPPAVIVESSMGILSDTLEGAARGVAEKRKLEVLPVYTYLANAIRKGDREVPYSLITATTLFRSTLPMGCIADAVATLGQARSPGRREESTELRGELKIILNAWTADQLKAEWGDRIEVDYFLWDPLHGLTTHTANFFVEDDCRTPIAGFAADRRLVADYPGITEANSLADWDPPFPVDLKRVRPIDEQYWKDYRTTPKAFIEFEHGRDLWKTRYGSATSIRILVAANGDPAMFAPLIADDLRAVLNPQAMGIAFVPARRLALEASVGATDFGEYFVYFSFFLVVSALLLTVLFFRLGIEQRLRQIGILRATGFTIAHVRRLLLVEAVVLAAVGSLAGTAGALAYGWLIVYGLRTWWVGAVGTTLLQLHISGMSLASGAIGGVVASALCVIVSLRAVGRFSPRALLMAQSLDAGPTASDAGKSRRAAAIAAVFGIAGLAMLGVALVNRRMQTGMFFGAATSLLTACLFAFSWWLRSRDATSLSGRGAGPIARLGFRGAAFRPSRSTLSVALIASAAFLIVSIDAFRHGGVDVTGDPKSGTGGFALMAQSEIPLLQNPNDPAGREALVVQAPEFSRVRFTRFRVRSGDDASCLNLYRPTNPTIIAPESAFLDSGRFSFASSLADTDAERANPWLLLRKKYDDDVIPVAADATSLEYVLHARVGDTFSMDIGGGRPLTLRFVAALSDSVLQSELVMSEENFVRVFSAQQGYRFFLIDAPDVRTVEQAGSIAGVLEQELAPFGFDAITAAERLAAFHRVENTYLSTFQALGGLGLVIGTIGLAAIMLRNALERRRELALLRAVGYDARSISIMIVAEAALLLSAGLLVGAGCAVLAIAPAWLGRGGTLPGPGLVALLIGVGGAGLLSSVVATRAALRGNMLEALRAE